MSKTYVSFLRGINVSGHKKIIMTDLIALYESLNFTNVRTYIQSGNVIFETEQKWNNTKLAKFIETKISEQYSFDVPIIIRSVEELNNVILQNPYKNDKDVDSDKLYVTFLANNPNSLYLESLDNLNYLPDKFEIVNKEIYIDCVSYGNTKLSNNFFENKLKVGATTRNWNTINKMIELSI